MIASFIMLDLGSVHNCKYKDNISNFCVCLELLICIKIAEY